MRLVGESKTQTLPQDLYMLLSFYLSEEPSVPRVEQVYKLGTLALTNAICWGSRARGMVPRQVVRDSPTSRVMLSNLQAGPGQEVLE